MTIIAYANMYSGMENPQKELSKKEYNKLKKLVKELNVSYTGPNSPQMGFTGYSVWDDKDNWSIRGVFTGWITVWSSKNNDWEYYKDTSGVMSYLQLIMGPVMQKHCEDAWEAIKKLNSIDFVIQRP